MEPKFITELYYKKIGARRWKLTRRLAFQDHDGKFYVVPRGFETDCNSVPNMLSLTTPIVGEYDLAGVLHDWLYDKGEYSKEVCDEIYFRAMEACKVTWYSKYKFYWGVKFLGHRAWNQHRRKDEKEKADKEKG